MVLRCLLIIAGFTLAQSAGAVEFNRDIRPILSDNCFHCHGPDRQRSGLRLDDGTTPFEKGVIVPRDAAASELVARITSSDPEFHMPPPEANRLLEPGEIDRLVEWIDAGAKYDRHWAFKPVRKVEVPQPADPESWMRNPIDAFILRRLEAEGMHPSPEASKETLLRRVSLDLSGLPPSVEALDAFLADTAPGAYERAVDRLLESNAYGERMANEWLDVARYADTFGYQNDRENHVWPWRDWVIRAFNDNLPYDRFIEWQLAGDLLPDATQDQRLATAFNRLHRQTNEGGSVDEEFRVEYAADRAQTVATAFMGITLECARCHDHKFDPIAQADYYRMFSFFNNIDESGMYSHFTEATPTPGMFLYGPGEAAEHERLKAAIKDAEAALDRAAETGRDRFDERIDDWFDSRRKDPDWWSDPDAEPVLELVFDDDRNVLPEGAELDVPESVVIESAGFGEAAVFNGEDAVTIKGAGAFNRYEPFSIAFALRIPEERPDTEVPVVLVHRTKASMDAASRGYELLLDENRLVFSLNHFWPGNAVRIETVEPLPVDESVHVTATYDGSSRADGMTLYVDGERAATGSIRDNLYGTILYEDDDDVPLSLGARFRDAGFTNGAIGDLRVFDRALTPFEARIIAFASGTQNKDVVRATRSDLYDWYLHNSDPNYAKRLKNLYKARKAEAEFAETLREVMVMREMPEPRQSYVLVRGDYAQRGRPVEPGVPDAIMPFPDGLPRDRLGLARWLTHPDHPLTARVTVNRYWQLFFGRGLVATPEDFGNQGAWPSHPELLDYLARRFIDTGWDLKALCRLIVTSAAYRQDATADPASLERDRENVLLARGPKTRLSAEQLRDQALAASGLLARVLGGPSVKPYQPAGLWRDASQVTYAAGEGPDLYRRSMYTFWKRTVPPPNMMTFDATNREVCVARREQTTTPMQALVLLNDPQFVEAARVLAEELAAAEPDDTDARLERLFRTLLARTPDATERRILATAYDEQRAYFAERPGEADAYLSVGSRPRNDALDPVDAAATAAVAQLLMNTNEFQVKP